MKRPAALRAPAVSGNPTPAKAGRKIVRRQVPAVTRAVAILRALGRSREPLGVNAIANQLDLIPSTCLHILRVLVTEELVAFDPENKKYTLGAGILTMARALLRQDSFADLARDNLETLSTRFGVTAACVEASGLDHMVVVAIARPAQAVRLHVDVGSRFPALISATGRCIAAFGAYDAAEIERRFRVLRWDRAPDWRSWRKQVAQTRERGYAVDEGQYIEGVTIIAVPVFAADHPSQFLVAIGLSEQLRRAGHEVIGQKLCDMAASLGVRLRRR
jgi:DNA-binding IclR family transcriptional regulator